MERRRLPRFEIPVCKGPPINRRDAEARLIVAAHGDGKSFPVNLDNLTAAVAASRGNEIASNELLQLRIVASQRCWMSSA